MYTKYSKTRPKGVYILYRYKIRFNEGLDIVVPFLRRNEKLQHPEIYRVSVK